MPYESTPEGKGKGGYVFNLPDVLAWRDKIQQETCTKPKIDDPDFIQRRPDHLNQLRYHAEHAVDHFIWFLLNHDEGAANIITALLRDAGLSKEEAYKKMQTLVFVLYSRFTDWVCGDEYFKTFECQNMDADGLWKSLTGEELHTRPPIDPDKVKFELPEWVQMKPADYVKEYWPD